VAGADSRGLRGFVPLLVLSGVVVLVVFGQARGLWLSNLHNGLLALAFAFVGAYVLLQRPGHREGVLFMATSVLEATMFFGRQIGHAPTSDGSRWWGWLGVWPLAIGLALATVSVLCFPDGRLPSPGWRWVAAAVVAIAVACSTLSAIWPVEYNSAGVTTTHPINQFAPVVASDVWSAIAHPAYIGFQLLWVLAVAGRWRNAGGHVRRQLTWLIGAAAVSVAALIAGLAIWQTPRAGLLTAALVPVAAGWAIVHEQHVVAYSALSWLSRTGLHSRDLPTDLARAVAEALPASGATLWVGGGDLHAVGVWPETNARIGPTSIDALTDLPSVHLRVVRSRESIVGAISIDRAGSNQLSLAESKLFDDLASHAALVIDHVGLTDVISRQKEAGQLDGLSNREREVLGLMARGLSNAAICDELHLSIKTVEPVVSTIFTKFGLHPDAGSNRRVLAVLTYLRT
jgi:DNA-binding CsgD family transcriptional regulator/branched-subunit amino acid transport protein